VVRDIFELAAGGFGARLIARRLNERGVPPFGPAGYWGRSSVDKILRNRATLGEYQPMRGRAGKRGQGSSPTRESLKWRAKQILSNQYQGAYNFEIVGPFYHWSR
jgi:hypothetical protein